MHNNFTESQTKYFNDIAILRIKSVGDSGIRFNSYSRSICLPTSNTTKYEPGMNCTITGWGSSYNQRGSNNSPKTFHSAVAQLLSNDDCKHRNPTFTNGVICTTSRNGASLGSGDAGGGLVCNLHGNFVLIGIASRKINSMTMYTGLVNCLPWINSALTMNYQ